MRDAIDTIKMKHGITVYVLHDESAPSPEDWDGVAEIAYKTTDNRSSRHCPWGPNYARGEEAFLELVSEAKEGKLVAVAVDVRDHGSNGIRLYVHDDLDDCEALFYCEPKKAVEEWGSDSDKLATILAEALTQECRNKAIAYMKGEVETWEQYFNGDVYDIVIHDARGKVLDSCGGYYGYEYAKSEAEQMGAGEVKAFESRRRANQRKARKEEVERLFWSFRGVVTA